MKPPCKDCQNRNMTCHSTCEAYLAFVEWNAKRLEERRRQCDIRAFCRESRLRVLKKTKWRRS